MPSPKKKESKQDFLKRCTADLIENEDRKSDQAYAMCNAFWDNSNGQKNHLSLSCPVELKENGKKGEKGKNKFLITAYTGHKIGHYWPVIIDLKGIKANEKMPILREHMRDRVVGWSTKTWEDKNFYIEGEFSETTKDGQEVLDLANEGFPWQASIGVWPIRIKVLESEKEQETVNGKKIKGPLEIWLESDVRETSFVAIGADPNTAGIAMSGDDSDKVPVDIEYVQNKKNGGKKIMDKEKIELTAEILKKDYPELFGEIQNAAKEESETAGYEKGLQAGIDQERERINTIMAVENVDPETKAKAISEGVSAEGSFKIFFEAEQGRKAAEAERILKEQEESVGAKGKKSDKDAPAGFMAEVDKYQTEKKCSRTVALQAIARIKPELHDAYKNSLNA